MLHRKKFETVVSAAKFTEAEKELAEYIWVKAENACMNQSIQVPALLKSKQPNKPSKHNFTQAELQYLKAKIAEGLKDLEEVKYLAAKTAADWYEACDKQDETLYSSRAFFELNKAKTTKRKAKQHIKTLSGIQHKVKKMLSKQ